MKQKSEQCYKADHKISPCWNRPVTTSSVDDERNNERERGSWAARASEEGNPLLCPSAVTVKARWLKSQSFVYVALSASRVIILISVSVFCLHKLHSLMRNDNHGHMYGTWFVTWITKTSPGHCLAGLHAPHPTYRQTWRRQRAKQLLRPRGSEADITPMSLCAWGPQEVKCNKRGTEERCFIIGRKNRRYFVSWCWDN